MTDLGNFTEELIHRIYDSEINFKIQCFWDTGFDVYLGDELNGFKDKSLQCRNSDAK